MNYIHQLFLIFILATITACGSGSEKQSAPGAPAKSDTQAQVPQSIREGKGIGEIKSVELTDPLDESMVKKGKAIVDMKCAACHKLTDQRVVGPGFQGVTNKRRPEWIMNMITNVEVMLDEDPVAQQLLEECLTRMPNQNVSVGDARDILEFLRSNDLASAGKKDGALN
jgi:mono/diheme cytochrome c family protein